MVLAAVVALPSSLHKVPIVKSHFDDTSSEKEPLCLIINGVAGTGKSYFINAIRNLLQSKCAVTA